MPPLLNPSSPRGRRLLRPVLAAVLVLGVSACDADGPVRPPQGQLAGIGGTGGSNLNQALVGSWERVFLFVDEFGFAHAVETTWQFRDDGIAVRTIVTRNITLGLADVAITTGQWTIDGTDLVLEFDPPNSGQVILAFTIVDDELTLAGEVYTRVGDL